MLNNPNLRPGEIAKRLQIKAPSVRRALFGLRKRDLVTKPVKAQTARVKKSPKTRSFFNRFVKATEVLFRRKITKSTIYCEDVGTLHKGSREEFFAITYEDNQISRFQEEIEEIQSLAESRNCHVVDEGFAYDDQQKTPDPPFLYPEIRVFEEFPN